MKWYHYILIVLIVAVAGYAIWKRRQPELRQSDMPPKQAPPVAKPITLRSIPRPVLPPAPPPVAPSYPSTAPTSVGGFLSLVGQKALSVAEQELRAKIATGIGGFFS